MDVNDFTCRRHNGSSGLTMWYFRILKLEVVEVVDWQIVMPTKLLWSLWESLSLKQATQSTVVWLCEFICNEIIINGINVN